MSNFAIEREGLLITADKVLRRAGTSRKFTEAEQEIIEAARGFLARFAIVELPRVGNQMAAYAPAQSNKVRYSFSTIITAVETPTCILVQGYESLVRCRREVEGPKWYNDGTAGNFSQDIEYLLFH